MRVFDLRYEGAREAALHPAIRDLPILGRGTFSIVYDAGASVRKLTLDGAATKFLTGHKNRLKALPKVMKDYGVVGRFKDKTAIHLIEVEKLAPINRHRREGHYARTLCEIVNGHLPKDWIGKGRGNIDYRVMIAAVAAHLRRDGRFSSDIQEAISYMGEVLGGSHFGLDFHPQNIMQRKQGELVLVDPVADYALYDCL